VWWTVRCRDEAPVQSVFSEDVCAQWPVGRSGADERAAASAVPLLALYAGLSPYVPATERRLPGMTRRTVVVDPTRGADVMIGCVRPWRNQWVEDPELEPEGLCPGVTPSVTGTRIRDD
jgi:hypothetical protein